MGDTGSTAAPRTDEPLALASHRRPARAVLCSVRPPNSVAPSVPGRPDRTGELDGVSRDLTARHLRPQHMRAQWICTAQCDKRVLPRTRVGVPFPKLHGLGSLNCKIRQKTV
jgi:hypothetical protein